MEIISTLPINQDTGQRNCFFIIWRWKTIGHDELLRDLKEFHLIILRKITMLIF